VLLAVELVQKDSDHNVIIDGVLQGLAVHRLYDILSHEHSIRAGPLVNGARCVHDWLARCQIDNGSSEDESSGFWPTDDSATIRLLNVNRARVADLPVRH